MDIGERHVLGDLARGLREYTLEGRQKGQGRGRVFETDRAGYEGIGRGGTDNY